MYCKNCGKEIHDHVKYCPYCGASADQNIPEEKQNGNTQTKLISMKKYGIPLIIIVAVVMIASFLFVKNVSSEKEQNDDRAWADQVAQAEWYVIEGADNESGLRFLKNDDGQVTVSVWLNSMRVTDFMPCTENDTMRTLTIPENDRQSSITGFTYVEKDDTFYLVAHYEDGDTAKCDPTSMMTFAQ